MLPRPALFLYRDWPRSPELLCLRLSYILPSHLNSLAVRLAAKAASIGMTGEEDPFRQSKLENQLLPGLRSSENPAFRRGHWAIGRPLVRSWLASASHCCGPPVGESSHASCRP